MEMQHPDNRHKFSFNPYSKFATIPTNVRRRGGRGVRSWPGRTLRGERVGKAPAEFHNILQAAFIGDQRVVMSCDGGGEFVREIPILGQVGSGGAMVNLKQIALGLQQVVAEVLRDFEHPRVLVGIGSPSAFRPKPSSRAPPHEYRYGRFTCRRSPRNRTAWDGAA